MSFFDSYKNYLNSQGSSLRELNIETMKKRIMDGFYDNPSYQSVKINNSIIPSDVWIIDDSKVKELKQIQMKPGDALSIGDMVNWKGNNWLTLIVDDMEVYFRGSIEKCNHILSFPGKETEVETGEFDWRGFPITEKIPGAPIQVPCIVTTKLSISNFTEFDRQINLPDGRIMVTFSYQHSPFDKVKEGFKFPFYGEMYNIIDTDFTKIYGDCGVVTIVAEKDIVGGDKS